MNYSEIKRCDIANGVGARVSLFVSGCTRRCHGCFNEVAWDFENGEKFTTATEDDIIEACRPDYMSGLSILGGEPMETSNAVSLVYFLRKFREELPGKTVWMFTGYTWDELYGKNTVTMDLLHLIDVMVDGPFIEKQKDITLRFRGSRNQRIINVPESLAAGEAVLWEDDPQFASHDMV